MSALVHRERYFFFSSFVAVSRFPRNSFCLGVSLTSFMSKKFIAAATIWASRTRLKKSCVAAKSFLTVCGMLVRLIRLASCFSVPLSLNEALLYRRFHITYIAKTQKIIMGMQDKINNIGFLYLVEAY